MPVGPESPTRASEASTSQKSVLGTAAAASSPLTWIKKKFCEHPGCMVQPTFNFPGERGGSHCSAHRIEGQIKYAQRAKQTPFAWPFCARCSVFSLDSSAHLPESFHFTATVFRIVLSVCHIHILAIFCTYCSATYAYFAAR